MLVRWTAFCVALLLAAPAFALEPLTLALLRMLRDHTITAGLEAGMTSLQEQPAVPPMVTWQALPAIASGAEGPELKALIDESFAYLTPHQRTAIYEGVMRVVSDPQHATMKPHIIAEFRIKATSVRETYRMLDRLSPAEKHALASQACEQYRKLPGEQRQELLAAVRSGMLPIPRDLSDIIIAEFSGVQPRAN
jgi:hypothetical protein